MSVFHDEIEIEDFEYDEETETFSYPCPCGDKFLITKVRVSHSEKYCTLFCVCCPQSVMSLMHYHLLVLGIWLRCDLEYISDLFKYHYGNTMEFHNQETQS